MLHILKERGIDIVEMQIQVYNKAMKAFDEYRGVGEKGDPGASYLSVCNQAIATLARYSYPTMTAVKVESMNDAVNDKVIDAVEVRQTILNDPFAASAIAATKERPHESLPILTAGIQKADDTK